MIKEDIKLYKLSLGSEGSLATVYIGKHGRRKAFDYLFSTWGCDTDIMGLLPMHIIELLPMQYMNLYKHMGIESLDYTFAKYLNKKMDELCIKKSCDLGLDLDGDTIFDFRGFTDNPKYSGSYMRSVFILNIMDAQKKKYKYNKRVKNRNRLRQSRIKKYGKY